MDVLVVVHHDRHGVTRAKADPPEVVSESVGAGLEFTEADTEARRGRWRRAPGRG
jgi:hypothetical protein